MLANEIAGRSKWLHAQVKLLMALSLIIAILTLPARCYAGWVAFGLLILLMLLLGGVKASAFLKRLVGITPFIALCAIGLLIGGSVDRFLEVVAKSTLCVAAATWLSLTTPFNELIAALRTLRMPSIMAMMLALLYRYIFVLGEEALRMQRAFVSRCPRKLSLPDAKYVGILTGALLLRAYDRADRIYMAMLSRGFDGEFRALTPARPKAFEWFILASFVALTFAISILLRRG